MGCSRKTLSFLAMDGFDYELYAIRLNWSLLAIGIGAVGCGPLAEPTTCSRLRLSSTCRSS